MTGSELRMEEGHCRGAQGEVLVVLAEALPGAGLPRLSAPEDVGRAPCDEEQGSSSGKQGSRLRSYW